MLLNANINASDDVPTDLVLEGSLDFQAAEKDSTAPPRFVLSANSGQPMQLAGFLDPVVVDIGGAKFDKKTTPVIADHDTSKRIGHTLEQVIVPAGGSATLNGKNVKGPLIAAYGQVSSKMGVAQGFVEDAAAGFPFQVSIGAKMLDGTFVAEGDSVTVNGKTFKGPLIVANKTLIRELTITVLGADNHTSAKLAANANNPNTRSDSMTFEAFVQSLGLDINALTPEQKTKLEAHWKAQQAPTGGGTGGGTGNPNPNPQGGGTGGGTQNPPIQGGGNVDLEAQAETQRRQRAAAEERRLDAIRATAVRFGATIAAKFKVGETEYTLDTFKAHAIEAGMEPDTFELHCLRNERPSGAIGGGGFAIHSKDREIEGQALQAALMRQTGLTPMRSRNRITGEEYGIECMFPANVLEESHRPQYNLGNSIQALFDVQIRAAGSFYPGSDRRSGDFFAATVQAWNSIQASGFSSLNITNVLENTMHKTALAAFNSIEAVWRFIVGRRALSDFRPHNMYRMTADGSFKQVSVTGELKHVSMTDAKYSLSADTYGAMITIDRKTMRNDDLGMVLDQARGIGGLGGKRIEESVFVLLLSNPGSFYSAGNGNLLTGGASALSVTSLETARQSFRNQVDSNGKPVGISPEILLVGTTLETTANRLWAEEKLAATGDTDALVFTNNQHKGLYRPIPTPYLNNTNITDQDGAAYSGQSDTQWYLFANPNAPQGASIVIGFLDGRDTPYFDEAETQFNVPGGMQFRSYLDWGVAMNVEELSLKSAGA